MSIRSTLLISLMGLWLCTGCATLVRGRSQKVAFNTYPNGAQVNVDGKLHTAPVNVVLKRKDPHTITVSAPGYQAIAFRLEAEWDGASLPNIALPGGTVWFTLDTIGGADKNFRTLATIKLNKTDNPTTKPTEMYQYRGNVMDKARYDKEKQEMLEYHRRPPD